MSEIESLLETLPPNWRRFIEFHYGLGGNTEHTLKETAEHFQMRVVTAEVLKCRIIRKLKLQKFK